VYSLASCAGPFLSCVLCNTTEHRTPVSSTEVFTCCLQPTAVGQMCAGPFLSCVSMCSLQHSSARDACQVEKRGVHVLSPSVLPYYYLYYTLHVHPPCANTGIQRYRVYSTSTAIYYIYNVRIAQCSSRTCTQTGTTAYTVAVLVCSIVLECTCMRRLCTKGR
jgi:hypothetical protein